MKTYKNLTFEYIKEEDIDILTPIMTRDFDEDSRIHLNKEKGGPDGYDNGEFLRKYALHNDSEAYKISSKGEVVGAVIVWIDRKYKRSFLGNIFVDTKYQNQGYGKVIWEFLQNEYPDTEVWGTETPAFSRRNHNFYIKKCGFHVIRIENPKDILEGSYIMEKRMK